MLIQKTASFCPNNKYFACFSCDNRLLVWEISANSVEIDFQLDSGVYGACISLHWISLKHNHASSKNTRLTRRNAIFEDQLLAVGTAKGDILLYNITAKTLHSHLVARHTDSVNDMYFYKETDSFFTCSNDKSIAVWDITTGSQKSKWIADDTPISSICVLDGNNLLSASKSILLWNISKKSIIKRFSGHSTEIFKLLPVNVSLSLKSCYFLSAAISDSKINAWSIKSEDCQVPVASFVLSGQPENIDVSRSSSKDNPLVLIVVSKDGYLNHFEHTLNGNVNQPLHPKTIINPGANCQELTDAAVICTKLNDDLESCTIAYGSSKDSIVFKHIRMKELLSSENVISSSMTSKDTPSKVNDTSKLEKNISINGLTSPSIKRPKTVKLKETSSIINSPRKKTKASSLQSDSTSSLLINPEKKSCDDSEHTLSSSSSHIRDSDIVDSDSSVGILLKGLQTQNKDLVDDILHNHDIEFICECVKNLPLHTLQCVLEELNNRLRHNSKSSIILRKWLKELLRVHLNYLSKSPETIHILGSIKDVIEAKRISETISRISVVKGLLSLQMQNVSSEESDSDSKESMES